MSEVWREEGGGEGGAGEREGGVYFWTVDYAAKYWLRRLFTVQ